jgi:hypothetical protein
MNLLALAIQAADPEHPEAKPVLGDAVLESGWWDGRVTALFLRGLHAPCTVAGAQLGIGPEDVGGENPEDWVGARAAKPSRKWCRAVLAVLLFGDWDTEMWPGVVSSVDEDEAYEGQIAMYGQFTTEMPRLRHYVSALERAPRPTGLLEELIDEPVVVGNIRRALRLLHDNSSGRR